jgi:thiol-disulfide isomerase/thioredoxin
MATYVNFNKASPIKLPTGGEPSFFSKITSGLKNTSSITLLIVGAIILFGIISILYYYYYVAPQMKTKYSHNSEDNTNGSGSSGGQNAEILFFFADWCPHCKAAKPIWNDLKSEYENKTINGYPFLFIRDSNKVIHLEVVIHSGFVHETKKNSGVNHLLEHVLVSGWKRCKESCNTYWDKHGALVNASTDTTMMKYYIKGDKKDIPDMVDYISTIITRSLFFPSTLEREKKAVLEELTNLLDNPSQEIYNLFHKAFYKIEGLKYTEDCALQIKNVDTLTMKDIKKAYEVLSDDKRKSKYDKFGVCEDNDLQEMHEDMMRETILKSQLKQTIKINIDIVEIIKDAKEKLKLLP